MKIKSMLSKAVTAIGLLSALGALGANVAKVGETEYATLAEALNAVKSGGTAELIADVTLTDEWTPIGTSDAHFTGSFNGNGHTISGLTVSSGNFAGLIGVLDGGTVKNVKFANVNISGASDVGAAVGQIVNNGTIDNVKVLSGSVSASAKRVGGVAGSLIAYGTIKNCENAAVVTLDGNNNAGGIVGAAYYTRENQKMSIANCSNTGNVTSPYCAGGIVGLSCADVSGCSNTATITAGTEIGGIVGEQKTFGSVKNCVNSGAITGSAASAYGVGGIIGWLRYHGSGENGAYGVSAIIAVTGNSNSGSISGGTVAGGIVGTVYNSAVVTGNSNTAATLSGTTFAAGIVGNYQTTETPALEAAAANNLNISSNTISQQTVITAKYPDTVIYTNGNTVDTKAYVAQIGNVKYETLAAALIAAQSGSTIEILDGTWDESAVGKLDEPGIYINAEEVRYKTLTIQPAEGATVKFTSQVYLGYDDSSTANASMTVKNLNFENASLVISNYNQVWVEDCKFKNTTNGAGTLIVQDACCTNHKTLGEYPASQITIKNCEIDGSNTNASGIRMRNSGNVSITGCTIKNSMFNGILFESNASHDNSYAKTVNVTSNTFTEWNATNTAENGRAIRFDGGNLASGSVVAIETNTFTKATLGLDRPDFIKMTGTSNATVSLEGNSWNNELNSVVSGNSAYYTVNGSADTVAVNTTVTTKTSTAKVGMLEYETLAEAVAAVPANGTATITMLKDVNINFNTQSYVTIGVNQNITLDLNGKTITSACSGTGSTQFIMNEGTLTINDSATGGKIVHGASPTWVDGGNGNYAGSYSSNLITNKGKLVVNSGELDNVSTGSAAYVIDNNSTVSSPIVEVNGGRIVAASNAAIRQFLNSTVNQNTVKINGGYVKALYYAIQMRNASSNKNKGTLTINGGELEATANSYNCSVCCWAQEGDVNSEITIDITGGTFNDFVCIETGVNATISGGNFAKKTYNAEGYTYDLDDYVKNGYEIKSNGNGTYGVSELTSYVQIGGAKYAQMADAVTSVTTTPVNMTVVGNGNLGTTETTAGEGSEFTIAGTYNISGTEWANIGYLQLNPSKATSATRYVINIVDSNLVVTKPQLRGSSDLVITNSHVDFGSPSSASRGYLFAFKDSTVDIKNSVVGYSDTNGNSSSVVAGQEWSGCTNGTMATYIAGTFSAEKSTVFTFTDEGSTKYAFAVYNKGLATFKDSVLYSGSVVVGANESGRSDRWTVGRDNEVATIALDNSKVIKNNSDQYKLIVGNEMPGKLILTNGSLIDHTDVTATVNANGIIEMDMTSQIKCGTIANAGAINIDATGITEPVKVIDYTGTSEMTLASYGTVNVTGGEAYVQDNDLYVRRVSVAQIGANRYASLAEAVAAAQSGDTITLLQNITGGGHTIEGKGTLTIDFNGKTYAFEAPGAGSAGTKTNGFQILGDQNVTFTNGTIVCSQANKTATWNADSTSKGIATLIQNYANLTLTGMTINGENIAHNGNNKRYVVSNNSGNVLFDNGTTITACEGDVAFDTCKYTIYPTPTVTLASGVTINGDVDVDGGDLVDNGAMINGDVNWVSGVYARVGKTKFFRTLEAAFADVSAADTIELTGNFDVQTNKLTVAAGTTVNLDLAGYTITAANTADGHIQVNGAFSVTNSTGNGKIVSGTVGTYGVIQLANAINDSAASFTLNGGEINAYFETTDDDGEHPAYGIVLKGNGSTVTINGGKVVAGYMAIMNHGSKSQNTTITVNGGSVESTDDYAIYGAATGTIVVNNGTVLGGSGAIMAKAGTVDVNGGELISDQPGNTGTGYDGTSGQAFAVINVQPSNADMTVTLDGGTFSAVDGAKPLIFTETADHKATVSKGANVNVAAPAGYVWNDSNVLTTAGAKIVSVVENVTNEVYYLNFTRAYTASAAKDTVVLLTNVVDLASTIVVDKEVTFDLNGHDITVTPSVDNVIKVTSTGDLTLTGEGTIYGPDTNGSASYKNGIAVILVDGGKLTYLKGSLRTIGGGNAGQGMWGVQVNNGATAVFGDETQGPDIETYFPAVGSMGTPDANDQLVTITINNGTYKSTATGTGPEWNFLESAVTVRKLQDLIINGGTFTGNRYSISTPYKSASTITINGGTFNNRLDYEVITTQNGNPVGMADDTRVVKAATNLTVQVVANYGWQVRDDSGYKYLTPATIKIVEDDDYYVTLQDAIAEVTSGQTIQLTTNIDNAVGISVPATANFTVDFNNKTYTVGGPGAGSAGTKTQAFQLLGGNVTFKNGTIACSQSNASATWSSGDATKGIAMLIQNYANLTLKNMTIDGTCIAHNGNNVRYVVSNNSGTVQITDTTITAASGDFAFDTCKYGTYTAPTVTVAGSSTINGKISLAGGNLNLAAGTVAADALVNEGIIDGVIRKSTGIELTAPETYEWVADGSGWVKLERKGFVMPNGENGVADLSIEWNWITNNVPGWTASTSDADILAALKQEQANQVLAWQNYLMGVDGKVEDNTLTARFAKDPTSTATEPKTLILFNLTFTPPQSNTGATVTYTLVNAANGEPVAGATHPQDSDNPSEFSIAMPVADGITLYTIKVEFTAKQAQ